MRRFVTTTLLLAAVIRLPAPAAAGAARYEVRAGKGTEVVFDSRALMEKFSGHTDQVSGWLEADLGDLTAPFRLEVTVDPASLDTGKGKRNQHMRENHLETDKYPSIVFTGGELAAGSPRTVPVGSVVTLQLQGTLALHGVSREMTCSVDVERPDETTLQVTARFEVLLPDYRIERPKFLMLKLAEDQQVTARLVLQKGP